MKNNKHKATLILVIFSLGFLISYPFSKDNFGIGLLSAICAASMIGGLADWFAVTAIFRKPLGIYWPRKVFRTEIIPRNRDGIINGLVDIIENDLLSKDSIKKKVMGIEIYDLFIQYIDERTQKGEQNEVVEMFLQQLYACMQAEDVESIITATADHYKRQIDIFSMISNVLKLSIQKGYDSNVMDAAVDIITGFVKSMKAHIYFTKFVEEIIAEYENGSSSRAMTVKMLMNFVLKKSPSDIAKMIEDELVNAIYQLKEEDNVNRQKIKDRLLVFITDIETNDELKNRIISWLEQNDEIIDQFSKKISMVYNNFKTENGELIKSEIGENINANIRNHFENIVKSSGSGSGDGNSNSEKMDGFIKELLISFINKKHSTIGVIVRDRINLFSTEELVELIEGVAGNDLQMIRINGSVVGGIVGMLTYLLTFYIR
jgi:uncharacterized membrane-anchored protein YjiN (DUF445 family)